MNSTLSKQLLPIAFLFMLGWALSLVYGIIGQLLAPGWLSIAVLHSVIALLIWHFGKNLRLATRWGLMAFLPAAAIVVGSLAASLVSRTQIEGAAPLHGFWDQRVLAFVLWIPLVEEIIFRFGIGGLARKRLGTFWGAYVSALVFAMAHGSGVWSHISIPIGPLLLGLCCEWLYVSSGRLAAAMALHGACNASAWIFSALDERWLNWLQALYLEI